MMNTNEVIIGNKLQLQDNNIHSNRFNLDTDDFACFFRKKKNKSYSSLPECENFFINEEFEKKSLNIEHKKNKFLKSDDEEILETKTEYSCDDFNNNNFSYLSDDYQNIFTKLNEIEFIRYDELHSNDELNFFDANYNSFKFKNVNIDRCSRKNLKSNIDELFPTKHDTSKKNYFKCQIINCIMGCEKLCYNFGFLNLNINCLNPKKNSQLVKKTVTKEFECQVENFSDYHGIESFKKKKKKIKNDWKPLSIFTAYTSVKQNSLKKKNSLHHIPYCSCFGKVNMRVKRAWLRNKNKINTSFFL